MRRVLSTLVLLIWGLWFGGLIVLFISVSSLFSSLPDRHVAGQGARHIFRAFNAYQLGLAAAALLITFAWWVAGPRRIPTALFTLFALATVGACVTTMYIAPQIEQLTNRGLTQSAQFDRLHGCSMGVYVAQSVLLLVAGVLLPWAWNERQQ